MARGQGVGASGGRRRNHRGGRGFRLQMPVWMEWYDYIMIPLLAVAGILIFLHIDEVLEAFLQFTVAVIDIGMLLVGILAVIAVLMIIFRRRRRW